MSNYDLLFHVGWGQFKHSLLLSIYEFIAPISASHIVDTYGINQIMYLHGLGTKEQGSMILNYSHNYPGERQLRKQVFGF